MTSQVNIIAVGGGKGGIGKSVVCTNLAIGMALSGQKVVLMDTDFGASNLHAMLGINNPAHGFQDFFNENKITNLEKYFDIKNSVAKEMNLIGLPTSFFINKKGDLIFISLVLFFFGGKPSVLRLFASPIFL